MYYIALERYIFVGTCGQRRRKLVYASIYAYVHVDQSQRCFQYAHIK